MGVAARTSVVVATVHISDMIRLGVAETKVLLQLLALPPMAPTKVAAIVAGMAPCTFLAAAGMVAKLVTRTAATTVASCHGSWPIAQVRAVCRPYRLEARLAKPDLRENGTAALP